MGTITCINIQPCKVESSENHNHRMHYLDYVMTKESHLNEHLVIVENLPNHYACLKKLVKEKTNQKLQEKATPIREGVIVISPTTTMDDLRHFADQISKKWGITTLQYHIHRDEGKNSTEKNLHAHLVFDWVDHSTGKSIKLNKHDMAKMQTVLADCLKMERGVSSDREHLSGLQFKIKANEEIAQGLKKKVIILQKQEKKYTDEATQLRKDILKLDEQKKQEAPKKPILNAYTATSTANPTHDTKKDIESLREANSVLSEQSRVLHQDVKILSEQNGVLQQYVKDLIVKQNNAAHNILLMRMIGLNQEGITRIFGGETALYSGKLYENDDVHHVSKVEINIRKSADGIPCVYINNLIVKDFFKQCNEKKVSPEKKDRGFRMGM